MASAKNKPKTVMLDNNRIQVSLETKSGKKVRFIVKKLNPNRTLRERYGIY